MKGSCFIIISFGQWEWTVVSCILAEFTFWVVGVQRVEPSVTPLIRLCHVHNHFYSILILTTVVIILPDEMVRIHCIGTEDIITGIYISVEVSSSDYGWLAYVVNEIVGLTWY